MEVSNTGADDGTVRKGSVKIHTSEPDVSLWASCDMEGNNRENLFNEVSKVLNVDVIPANTTIGTVTISGGDVEFEPDDLIVEDYGWDD